MARRWRSFNQSVTDKEALTLPTEDRKNLFRAMGFYARGDDTKAIVKSYGDDLLMIKDSSRGQGRCLFFSKRDDEQGNEWLTALPFYKKETQEVPPRILDLAHKRLKEEKEKWNETT